MFGKLVNNRVISTILLACALAVPVHAATWQGKIDESGARIRSGDYDGASKELDRIISEMVEQLGGGEADNQLFATALTYKAMAAGGQGSVDEALWDWYVAQDISPAVAKFDFTGFGTAGDLLKYHPMAAADAVTGGAPSQVLQRVVPKFPTGASRFGIFGDLIVQVVVDPSGAPTLPRIIHPLPAATLSFVALDALRQWRFQPATHNGQPVASVFNLTVHYKL